jgi:tetratricopeptide (TPR) repeat protein
MKKTALLLTAILAFTAATLQAQTFPSGFVGTWKRDNYNNTITITSNKFKSSSQTSVRDLLGVSGDNYTITSGSGKFTFIIKLVNGNLVISGDSGDGQDNWNGTWRKQSAADKSADDYFIQADVYYKKKDFDSAIRELNEAIRLNPKSASMYIKRGDAYSKKNDYDRAIANYAEAIKLEPTVVGYNSRGINYLDNKKDYDRAIADFTESIRLDPNHSYTYNLRGEAYLLKKDYDRAIADFEAALRLDPKDDVYKANLAQARKARQDSKPGLLDRALSAVSDFLEPSQSNNSQPQSNPNNSKPQSSSGNNQPRANNNAPSFNLPARQQVRHFACGGTGRVTCIRCRGSGVDSSFTTDSNGDRMYRPCGSCGGSGGGRCSGCNGTGWVYQ